MKARLTLGIVGLLLFVQLGYFVGHNPYPHGDIVDVSHRQKQRLAAFLENKLNPSSDTRAELDVELKRMRRNELDMMILKGSVLLTVDDSFCPLPRRQAVGNLQIDFTPWGLGDKATLDGKMPFIEEGEPFIDHPKMG